MFSTFFPQTEMRSVSTYGRFDRRRVLALCASILLSATGVTAGATEPDGPPAADRESIELFGGERAPVGAVADPGTDVRAGTDTGEPAADQTVTRAGSPAAPEIGADRPRDDDETTGSKTIARPAPDRSLGKSGTEDQAVSRHSDTGKGWFRMRELLPLLVVLGLIGVAAWVVKRFLPGRGGVAGGGVMEILARMAVSPKQTLLLVKVGRRVVLLGASADRVTALSEVEDPDEVARLVGESASQGTGSMTRAFADAFRTEASAYDPEREDDTGDPTQAASGEVRGLLNKVRRMRARTVA